MNIVLDRGHGQKGPHDVFDPGVTVGKIHEVDLAATYVAAADARLRALGHQTLLLTTGTYDARHQEAIAWAAGRPGPAVYVQCHVNAGKGKYGVVEYDRRSSRGRTAAAAMADALDEMLETPKVHVWDLDPGERGWVCIDDIWTSPTMCGLIYEPFFIDSAEHAGLQTPSGLARVGRVLADGICRFDAALAARKAA